MIAEQYKEMLNGKSVIRELSEYATARGKEIGYENVFDYSLGNPSVPAPESFKEAMIKLLMEGDAMEVHGYSPSLGIAAVKEKVAESLNRRFGMCYTFRHIFMTAGAAGAIAHAVRAVTVPGVHISMSPKGNHKATIVLQNCLCFLHTNALQRERSIENGIFREKCIFRDAQKQYRKTV